MVEHIDRCLICGGRDLRKDFFAASTLNLADEHGVSLCGDCGFRFLNPRPTAAQYRELYSTNRGELLDVYPMPTGYYADEDALRLSRQGEKLDILERLGAGKEFLEIGACTGSFLNMARQRGFSVQGIEPDLANCSVAVEKHGLQVVCSMVEECDFPEGSFDVIFASHVFEHFLDPLGVTRRATKWLKPGGLLMIEVPDQFNVIHMKRKRYEGRIDPIARSFLSIHHTAFFSRKSLSKLSFCASCRPVHVRNVYYSDPPNPFRQPRAYLSRLLNAVAGGSGWLELLARKEPRNG
jgi:2-polyprenyl-3-methyl-5-hydroxy-6-metoxy-1,4-benzoquinol methylase